MVIVKPSNVKAIESTEEIVKQGMIFRQLLIDEKTGQGVQAAMVTYNPGARLNFHTHEHEQVLYVTEGTGIVATEEKEYVVTKGDVILIPAGENHWHGATRDSWFTHFAVFRGSAKVD